MVSNCHMKRQSSTLPADGILSDSEALAVAKRELQHQNSNNVTVVHSHQLLLPVKIPAFMSRAPISPPHQRECRPQVPCQQEELEERCSPSPSPRAARWHHEASLSVLSSFSSSSTCSSFLVALPLPLCRLLPPSDSFCLCPDLPCCGAHGSEKMLPRLRRAQPLPANGGNEGAIAGSAGPSFRGRAIPTQHRRLCTRLP